MKTRIRQASYTMSSREAFNNARRHRGGPGSPFESFRIRRSTISSERAFSLNNLVQNFYWDGWDEHRHIFDPKEVYSFDSDSFEPDEDVSSVTVLGSRAGLRTFRVSDGWKRLGAAMTVLLSASESACLLLYVDPPILPTLLDPIQASCVTLEDL